jgi:hypothetical protein
MNCKKYRSLDTMEAVEGVEFNMEQVLSDKELNALLTEVKSNQGKVRSSIGFAIRRRNGATVVVPGNAFTCGFHLESPEDY